MSEPNREAVEAACRAYAQAANSGSGITWRLDGPLRTRMEAALTAALPYLTATKDEEIAALREALKPFAEAWEDVEDEQNDEDVFALACAGDFRRAREMSGGVK